MLNNRMQNLDTEKEISIPKRRLRPPQYHKKNFSIPKKTHPKKLSPTGFEPAICGSYGGEGRSLCNPIQQLQIGGRRQRHQKVSKQIVRVHLSSRVDFLGASLHH